MLFRSLESSILSPGSFADAEVQVLDATTGADGLTVRAIGIEADALGVRAVVAALAPRASHSEARVSQPATPPVARERFDGPVVARALRRRA